MLICLVRGQHCCNSRLLAHGTVVMQQQRRFVAFNMSCRTGREMLQDWQRPRLDAFDLLMTDKGQQGLSRPRPKPSPPIHSATSPSKSYTGCHTAMQAPSSTKGSLAVRLQTFLSPGSANTTSHNTLMSQLQTASCTYLKYYSTCTNISAAVWLHCIERHKPHNTTASTTPSQLFKATW